MRSVLSIVVCLAFGLLIGLVVFVLYNNWIFNELRAYEVRATPLFHWLAALLTMSLFPLLAIVGFCEQATNWFKGHTDTHTGKQKTLRRLSVALSFLSCFGFLWLLSASRENRIVYHGGISFEIPRTWTRLDAKDVAAFRREGGEVPVNKLLPGFKQGLLDGVIRYRSDNGDTDVFALIMLNRGTDYTIDEQFVAKRIRQQQYTGVTLGTIRQCNVQNVRTLSIEFSLRTKRVTTVIMQSIDRPHLVAVVYYVAGYGEVYHRRVLDHLLATILVSFPGPGFKYLR